MDQIRGISWACSPRAFGMLISETLRANLQGDKVQNMSLPQSSMHSISEALPLYFDSWRYFCCFYLVRLLHVGVFDFHVTEKDFSFFLFWWLCFPAVSMSLPTKVLNTHRKSLNLVDNPRFFETKVRCGNFYVCGFRMQCCSLSLCFPFKPYARWHFSSQTSKALPCFGNFFAGWRFFSQIGTIKWKVFNYMY